MTTDPDDHLDVYEGDQERVERLRPRLSHRFLPFGPPPDDGEPARVFSEYDPDVEADARLDLAIWSTFCWIGAVAAGMALMAGAYLGGAAAATFSLGCGVLFVKEFGAYLRGDGSGAAH